MPLQARPVPPISKEFFAELEKTFGSRRLSDIRPGKHSLEEIAAFAAEARVVEWARNHIRGPASSGNVEVIVKPND